MARVKKPQPTLESMFFSTPEQKVIRFLLSEPTTTFTSRVISSKLKGVRGLGGTEGIMKILAEFAELGMVDFVDNNRAVRLRDDNPTVALLKTFAAVCDLEGVKCLLEPVSSKGVLFGCRAEGKATSDSEYNVFVVSDSPEEVRKIASRHPLGKRLEVEVRTSTDKDRLEDAEPGLFTRLSEGIVLWGTHW